jgi:hypothetical protein
VEIGLRLKECHDGVCHFFRTFGHKSEKNDPASRRKPSAEDKLAEILVEGEKDSLTLRTEGGHFLVRDAGTFLGH